MNSIIDTLSFDDVLISPRYSNIDSRKTINLKSQLTKNITLNLPLISSPMDTITESKMAIEMALNGGLGIIHRYNTIEQQVSLVKEVKRHLSFVIEKPYTILETETVIDLLNKVKQYNVYSYLVTDDTNTLKGIVTKRDLNAHIMNNGNNSVNITKIMISFDNIIYLIENSFTKTDVVNLMNKHKIEKVPIIDENNKIKGMILYKHLMNYKLNKEIYSFDKQNNLLVGAAVGIVGDYLERSKQLIEAGCDILCIDVANGFNQTVYNVVKELKELYPTTELMVGNVCNAEGFEFLCRAGADCIRVGIGNGSICSTRLVTGVGSGQFTALMECRRISRKYNVGMISDGGHLGKDGNISKAFVVGANAMILGKTLAATDETPGRIINRNNRRVKYYRGMASAMAMASKAEISNQEYNDSQNPEGVDMEIEIKGPVKSIVKRIESSIKSTMSYIGCKDTDTLRSIETEIMYYKQSAGVMSETSIRGKIL
jgi:IMP dehydrogenase